jgi:hypothetical protein
MIRAVFAQKPCVSFATMGMNPAAKVENHPQCAQQIGK